MIDGGRCLRSVHCDRRTNVVFVLKSHNKGPRGASYDVRRRGTRRSTVDVRVKTIIGPVMQHLRCELCKQLSDLSYLIAHGRSILLHVEYIFRNHCYARLTERDVSFSKVFEISFYVPWLLRTTPAKMSIVTSPMIDGKC